MNSWNIVKGSCEECRHIRSSIDIFTGEESFYCNVLNETEENEKLEDAFVSYKLPEWCPIHKKIK